MNKKQEIEKFLEKIEKLKKEHKLDLSSEEDLSIAVMNLVSLEEHFFFTGAKTGKEKYYNLLSEVREIRKGLLQKLIKRAEGETWCISKHLLAASMRLIEVGTKYFAQGRKKEAGEFFSKAYHLYSLFWGINLGLVKIRGLKKISDKQLNVHDQKGTGLLEKLEEIVKKIVNCCRE